MELFIYIPLIIFLSIIQSVMGVGLLLFGTPTLMLLNVGFEQTLSFLLPCSITISLLQMLEAQDFGGFKAFQKDILTFCIPCVLLGIGFIFLYPYKLNMNTVVGCMLIGSGVLKTSTHTQALFKGFLKRYQKIYLVIMGLLHGLSNMGGGLLTLYSSTLFSNKNHIRSSISFGYLSMGLIQYVMLLFYHSELLHLGQLLYPLIALFTYFLGGKYFFHSVNEKHFLILSNSLVFIYGLLLVLK